MLKTLRRQDGTATTCRRRRYPGGIAGRRLNTLLNTHQAPRNATKSILATCFLLSLALADASNGNSNNNGGNRNGAPFMIMSEITVESPSKDAAANAEISRDDDDAAALQGGGDASTGANDTANAESASSSEETHNDSGSGSDTDEDEDEGVASTSSSPPLRTLQRLQAMLDDSDYASAPIQEASLESAEGRHPIDESSASSSTQEKLWTSKDRVKYRRTRRTEKQRRQQREFEEHQARKARDMQRLMIIQEEREREDARRKEESLRNIQERQRRQQFVSRDAESSELTDEDTDTDAANEFELTNNPVYFSDGEQSDDFSEEDEHPHLPPQSSPEFGQHQNQMPNHMNHMSQYGSGNYQHQFSPPQQRFGPDQHHHMPNMPQNYQQYPPQQPQYSQFSDPHQQQMIQDARQYSQQYAAWAQAAAIGYHYPPPQPPTTPEQPYNTNQNLQAPPHQHHPASSFDPRYYQVPQQQRNYYPPRKMYSANHKQQRQPPYPHPMQNFGGTQHRNTASNRAQESPQQAEAKVLDVKVTGDAGMQREALADNVPSKNAATSSIHSQMGVRSAVVPPTSPLISASPPRTSSLMKSPEGPYCELVDESIGTFHVSFTLGYALAFIAEVITTTLVRLGVFKIWEPAIFNLTPEVPSIILPWVLREKQYKPKRITLFAADFAASCIASPVIEEIIKLKVVQWTCRLPRNFKTGNSSKGKGRKKRVPVRGIDSPQVTNINCYMVQMLAASLGLKLFDVTRRILMYTKDNDRFKKTYAVYRGVFPIHELCGAMTALLLARRDVLGVSLPTWKILGPAVFIHGMANFRGMKPIFKWNSASPWSEMQINQLSRESDVPLWRQLMPKSYAKLVWLTILCRVFGFCIKNYYLIGRQAVQRTTVYSGKLYAFNAKLETDAMLKRIKKD
ncbi:hypothetical protein THAOC_16170 [Thalassiosira oceanica]|uniref:Uncharacterized protein n=1 Tax=Thalassiosira oceanica TaxID=159749 RepID=K0SCY5_THAOC|nr:hypothetical protein THAOC_16170 [Thalassiosira oceanica]|eukprot:EJK63190.1 hypothetical protein THAOC_16170 [Thalassiosira oceanica]